MGLLDYAQQKLNDALDNKMKIRQDSSTFYRYVCDHAEEFVKELREGFNHKIFLGTEEVGIQSHAKDVVEELQHDDNGAYVDSYPYRFYVRYDVNFSSLFYIVGYTGGNDSETNGGSSNDFGTTVDTSNSSYSGNDYNNADDYEDRQEREERKKREREEEEENKKKAAEINKAPMPEAKDIVWEIKTCEQNSDNYSFSYEERHAYESRANLLKEYAKQKYANDPAVKAYLRKEAIHNHRFLIMWCVFLVAAVIVFILCNTWWHYVLAVLGTIVVAVVLFFIHEFFGD